MPRIIFSLSDDLFNDLDNYCAFHRVARSELLRFLIREKIEPDRKDKLPPMRLVNTGPEEIDLSKMGQSIINPNDTAIIEDGRCQKCQISHIPVQDIEWQDADNLYRMNLCHGCFSKLKIELKNSGGKLEGVK